MVRKRTKFATSVFALFLLASPAIGEPVDEAFALCAAPPKQSLEVEKALKAVGWQPIDINTDIQARQQLTLAFLREERPTALLGESVAKIPGVAGQMNFGKQETTVTLAKPGTDGRDIVSVARTESSVFFTSRCLIAAQGTDNPVTYEQITTVGETVNSGGLAWMIRLPMLSEIPGASSSETVATLISESAREGFLRTLVLADIAFDSLISFPKEAQ